MQGIPGQPPVVPFKSTNPSSFSTNFKKTYSHLLDNPELEQNSLNLDESSSPLTSKKLLFKKKTTNEVSFQNDFFAREAPNDSSVFGLNSASSFQSQSSSNNELLSFPPKKSNLKDASSSKRLSQSFTPSQPDRYSKSLTFWKAENPLSDTSAIDPENSTNAQNMTKSKFGMASLIEGDSSPYLLDHDVPSDIASADHTFESNGTKENIQESFGKSSSIRNGDMVGVSFERTGFSFASNMLLDHNNVPDAAAHNESSSLDVDESSNLNSNKFLSESLLEQVMPESPRSYRPSPLAKYTSNLSPFQSASSYRTANGISSSSSSPVVRNQKFDPSISPSGSSIPSTPANNQDLLPVSTTPVDVLKRRLERSEETLHQYENDLVELQNETTKLEEINMALRKELEEEKKRVYMEENEAYELEQDRDLYKQENEGLRSQLDEMMEALKIRDSVEMEQTVELSEMMIKLESSQRKCSVLEEQVSELARINEDLSQTTSDRYTQLVESLEKSQQKCNLLEEKLKESSQKNAAHVMNSIETQSDFQIIYKKSPGVDVSTHMGILLTEAASQAEEDFVSQAITEDLSAFIVNKDESIFNHEQFELIESEVGVSEKLKIDKLIMAVDHNDLKMAEVKSNMNDIRSKTMQVRQDLLVNSHFGKEVERWVDDMKVSVECVENFILEANQALKVEKRRSERLGELIRRKPVESKDCQTDNSTMDSKYVQTKNKTLFLNAGIQTTYPNMMDQDIQTDCVKSEMVEDDSLELLFSSQKPLLGPIAAAKVDTASQTMLLFDMMDSDFTSKRHQRMKNQSTPDGLYRSSTFTGNLVQLFITLLCLLVGYVLYNMYELFGFLRSVLRIAKDSKIALM